MMSVKWIGESRAFTPGRSASEPRTGTSRSRSPETFPPVLLLSIWFGLITALVELVLAYARNHLLGWSTLSALQISRHFPWMVPLANFVLFLAWGVIVVLLGRLWGGIRGQPSVFLLSAPACLALVLEFPGLYGIAYIVLAIGAALWVAWWISIVPGRVCRVVQTSLPALFISISVFAVWQGGQIAFGERWTISALPEHDRHGINVLFLVMDTVRADRLSLHGYNRETMPNLTRIGRRSIRFEQARATAPWTLPSHASMFTGLWPHETGVAENSPLDTSFPTVAEFLLSHGYLTAGFVGNTYFCNSWFGLGRGFAHYEDFYDEDLVVSVSEALHTSALGRGVLNLARLPQGSGRGRKTAAEINGDFLNWLSRKESGRPFFVFINYFDAHSPYLVPEDGERLFGRRAENPAERALLQGWENRSKQNVTESEATLVSDAYDDCIHYVDTQIGKLIDELEGRGLLDNTVVVVTSDHGEELGDHGLFGHGRSLYSQEVHVPLIIRAPGGSAAARVVSEPVSLRDLPATLVDLLGYAHDSPFPGSSLRRFWDSGPRRAGIPPSPAYSEVALRDKVSKNPARAPAWRGPMQAVVADRRSYIRNADGRAELYDLKNDPAELHDLAGSAEPDTLVRFGELIESLFQARRP